MNIVHSRIVASPDAILNSAVAQGSGLGAQVSAFADPAPLSTQEALSLALLQAPAPVPTAPASVEKPKGGRLDIRT